MRVLLLEPERVIPTLLFEAVLPVRVLSLEKERKIPCKVFELAVLPVRVLPLELKRTIPSELFELAVLPVRVLPLEASSLIPTLKPVTLQFFTVTPDLDTRLMPLDEPDPVMVCWLQSRVMLSAPTMIPVLGQLRISAVRVTLAVMV